MPESSSRRIRDRASAIDVAEYIDDLGIRTSRIRTIEPSGDFSQNDAFTCRIIIDIKSFCTMDGIVQEKVYKFLAELENEMQSNNTSVDKVEFYIGDHSCQPTFQFGDELQKYMDNPPPLMPELKVVIDGFGATPNNNIWFIITSRIDEKEVPIDFPVKIHKNIVLDFGRYARNRDEGLINYLILKCYADGGLPIVPLIIELVASDGGPSQTILDSNASQHNVASDGGPSQTILDSNASQHNVASDGGPSQTILDSNASQHNVASDGGPSQTILESSASQHDVASDGGPSQTSFDSNASQHNVAFKRDRRAVEQDEANKGFDRKERLGKGVMGPVYKYANSEEKSMAIKFQPIDQMTQRDIDREMGIFEILDKNAFFGVFPYKHLRTDDMIAQYFPVYSNGSLRQCLKNRRLSSNEKENMMSSLAQGLHWLLTQNIVHLDIKLCNILVDHHLSPTLSDFGFAQIGPELILESSRGTPGFASPEAWTTRRVNHKSDCFSLGLVYYSIWNRRVLLTERHNKYRHMTEFWENWCPMVDCGKWSGLVKRMISVTNEERPSAQQVLIEMREERDDECQPFRLSDAISKHTLKGRSTIMHVLSFYAEVTTSMEFQAESVAESISRLAQCAGITTIAYKISTKELTFFDAKEIPPHGKKYVIVWKQRSKSTQVRLYLSKERVNHFQTKTDIWHLLKEIFIAVAVELKLNSNLDSAELALRLNTFLSLY